MLLVAGCSCDDRLIDLPSKDRFGDPIEDRVMPVRYGPPDVESPSDPDGPSGDGIEPGFRVSATGGADCAGGAVPLTTRVIGGTPPLRYEWSPATGLSDPASANPFSTDGDAHEYRVTVTDATGATATATARVERRALPVADLRIVSGSALSCEGAELVLDASGSLSADGSPVSIAWDLDGEPATTEANGAIARFVPSEPVTVRLTVTDALGCSSSAEQPIEIRPLPLPAIAITQGSDRVCFGEAVALDGSDSVDADGGPVAAYAWDLDGNAANVEESAAAVPPYAPTGAPVRLTVTDSFGCSATAVQPVVVGALPQPRVAFLRGGSLVCAGEAVAVDGSGSTDLTGGPVAGYAWDLDGDPITVESTVPTPPAIVPSGTGAVRLVVTDAWGCSNEASVPVAARALPVAAIDFGVGARDSCAGDAVDLSGASSRDADGSAVATYAWDLNGDGSADGSGRSTGSFVPADGQQVRLTVTDALGCSASTVQDLAPRPLPTVSLVFTQGGNFSCSGANVALDGSGSVDADGNPVASYAWDLDGVATTVEGTTSSSGSFAPHNGNVTLTVQDARGCTASRSQSLAVGNLPTPRITFAAGAARVCSGETVALDGSGSTDAAGAPVASYAWDLDGDGTLGDSAAAAPAAFAPAGTRLVRLRVTDANGCFAETTQSVAARDLPTAAISFAQGRANACAGDSVALSGATSRDADGNPVASYAWDLNGDGNPDGTGNATTPFVPAGGQQVRLVVTDTFGCSASTIQLLAPRALPTPRASFTQGGAFVCAGGQVALDGSASTDADGNQVASWAWDLDGNPATVERSTATTGPFAPTSAAILTVRDVEGCSASLTQPLSQGALPTARIAFTAGASQVCSGATVALDGSGSRDATGAPVASYSWDLDGDGGLGDSSAAAPPGFAPAGTRTVRLRVTDTNGCFAEATQPVSARGLPSAVIAFDQGRSNVCAGGNVALRGTDSRDADGNAVFSYAWDLDGNGTIDRTTGATGTFVPAGNATARLVVTDRLGCSAEATQSLAPRAPPTPSIAFLSGSNRVCSGTQVQLDGSGSRDADGNPVGIFAWDLDGNGTDDATVATPPGFTPAATRSARLRVTDALGCSASATQAIAVRGLPTARITFAQGAQSSCDGSTLGLSGTTSVDADGRPVAAYSWDLDGDGAADGTGPSSGPFTPHQSATATLTVSDAEGCSASASQPYTVRPLPQVDAGADVALCSGGTAQLGGPAQPGVSYTWSPTTNLGGSTSSNPLATPSATTTYTVTARNTFGCTATDSVQVRVNPLPVADAGPDRQVGIGGSVHLLGNASGGTPGYTWAWAPAATLDDPAVAQPSASPTANQTYALTVTDANGCSASDVASVLVRPGVTVHASGEDMLCLDGGSSVTLAANASGGVQPLSYRWTAQPACGNCIANPTAPSTAVSPRQTTTFTVTVTDANGAQVSDAVTVNVMQSLHVDAGPDQHIQRGGVVQIGTPPVPGLTYTWTCDNWSCGISDPGLANPWVAPAGNTAYRVTVTNGSTCTGSDVVLVTMDVRVLATVPEEGYTPWPRDALIWVAFDSDIDPATVAGNAEIWDPRNGTTIPFTSRYDSASRTLEIDPVDSAYWNNRPYALRLKGGPTGIGTPGNVRGYMYSDFVLEYTASSNGDGRAPNYTWVRPNSGATGVISTADMVIQFDEPVDPSSINGTTFTVGNVAGTVSYDPRTWVATFRPNAPLAANTRYTATINGVRDGAQNRANFSWSFTTGAAADTTPPTVTTSDPVNGALSVDVGTPFTVTFSEPVDTSTLGGIRLIDVPSGYPVSAEIEYDELTRTATIDPQRILEPAHAYRIDVSRVADPAGNVMVGTTTIAFTTVNVVFLERFESGAAGWTFASPWAVHFQGTRAGSMGLVDSPVGNTPLNLNAAATSPVIPIANRASVTLSFWNRRLMPTDADQLVVEYSTNGTTWSTAGSALQDPAGWRLTSRTIPTTGASQLRIRLRMSTNASLQLDGVGIDELVIR